jgi:hypothetical protein
MAQERNSEFKVLARCLELAEEGSNAAEQVMSYRNHRRSLRRLGEAQYPPSQLARHTILSPQETEVHQSQ